jgi:hypothetical protein
LHDELAQPAPFVPVRLGLLAYLSLLAYLRL